MIRGSISLCMIVKNEENYIEKCLESVKGRVDEIIIVDTGSSDQTLTIAKKYTQKIYDYKWNNDFAEARNYSISKATSEYILILDADEYLDSECTIQHQLDDDYYMVKIKNYLENENAMNHYAIRLFRNDKGLIYKNRIHEHLNVNDISGLTFSYSQLLIHHVGYLNELIQERNKNERNLKMLLNEAREKSDGYTYFNLGMHYQKFDKPLEAIEAYQKSYQLGNGFNYIPKLILGIAECLCKLTRFTEAIDVLRDAVIQYPFYTDLYFALGQAYEKLDYLYDAEICYLKCIELGDVTNVSTASYEGVGSYMAFARLSNVYLLMGERLKAISILAKAVKTNKYQLANLVKFIELNVSLGASDFIVYLENLYSIQNEKDINTLLKALFSVRSPLLNYFMLKYVEQTDLYTLVISKQYSGHYKEAKELWFQIKEINNNHINDIILLSILLQDSSLINHFESTLNLNKDEKKILGYLITGQNLRESVKSKDIESLYLFMAKKLIILKEFETFQFLFEQSIFFRREVQIQLSKMLYELGFVEIARDLAIQIHNNLNSSDRQLERLIGDMWTTEHYYDEALERYNRILRNSENYADLVRVYHIYKKKFDNISCNHILRKLTEDGIHTIWMDSQYI